MNIKKVHLSLACVQARHKCLPTIDASERLDALLKTFNKALLLGDIGTRLDSAN